ncbi:MAG: portal protein [Synergistales bacterium]|nr:portal protein [Synergistales bacterium]
MTGIAGDLSLVIVAGLIGGSIARLLKQPLILGYILAGILVGPYTGGATVSEVQNIEKLADIGIALLLFSLGLEFSVKELRPIGRIAFGGTAIQVGLTMVYGVIIGQFMGWGDQSVWFAAAMVSSSTAVILKTLNSRGFASTLSGRIMLGMSIVQDMTLIPIMILLVHQGEGGLISSVKPVLYAVSFVLVMTVLSVRAIPWILKQVSRWESRELFLLFVVALGLGVGSITSAVGLSFAFGAFVAGMVLSESDYGHKALSELASLRDIFGMLFFVSVGMLLDPGYLRDHLVTVLCLVSAVTLGKGAVLAAISWLMGYRRVIPMALFFGMLPISEIAFVLIRTGMDAGALTQDLYSLILNTVILSMVLGPTLSGLTAPVYRRIKGKFPEKSIKSVNLPQSLSGHRVVAGGGPLTPYVADLLRESGHPYVVIEPLFHLFESMKKQGHPAIYGDPSQQNVMEAVHIKEASLIIMTTQEIGHTLSLGKALMAAAPSVPKVARGDDHREIERLTSIGIDQVVIPKQGAAIEMVRTGDTLIKP